MKHVDLFAYAGSKAEVYKTLQRDYERDHKRCNWLSFVAALMIGAAFADTPFGIELGSTFRFLLALFGIILAIQYLVTFIDNSNRNWSMHVIDWIENRGNE